MKKKILALAVILAMIVGATNIAIATDTKGSIEFTGGEIIVNPPHIPDSEDPEDPGDCGCCPDCCECDAECEEECVCDCPCGCTCDEKDDYDHFFYKYRVANNLYFGEHDLTVYGDFDSANATQTSLKGMYTGVEVINLKSGTAQLKVKIDAFKVDGTGPVTLAGAELTLMKQAVLAEGGGTPYTQGDNIVLTPSAGDQNILTVGSGRMVKASWYGILNTLPGTAAPGTAQATLTWTAVEAP